MHFAKKLDLGLDHIVKLNVSLQDLSLFNSVNEIMKELFTEPFPARAALQVARLPLDSSIEVEAILSKSK
jgi:enamine deaminase RidA (YjgF/YER057c/UK114 family)